MKNRKDNWNLHWNKFEGIWRSAEHIAHGIVINNITSRIVQVWPTLPPLPLILSQNATTAEKNAYNSEMVAWGDTNLLIIPKIQYKIRTEYDSMHYREAVAEVNLRREDSEFANNSVAFQHLSRAFMYRSSLPGRCSKYSLCLAQVIDILTILIFCSYSSRSP